MLLDILNRLYLIQSTPKKGDVIVDMKELRFAIEEHRSNLEQELEALSQAEVDLDGLEAGVESENDASQGE